MSLKLENLLVNFGVSEEAIDILLLKEPFEWENTTKAIYEVEEKLNKFDLTLNSRKIINKIITESLDNVCRHSEVNDFGELSSFSCKIELNSKNLFVTTRNIVPNSSVGALLNMIQELNNLNKDELNDLYRHQLKNGSLDNQGNAGLGLIEIARKTKQVIKYNFEYFNNEYTFFTLFITINFETI